MSNGQELFVASPSMFRNHPCYFLLCLLLCVVGIGIVIFLIWWLKCRCTVLTLTEKTTTLRKGILSRAISEVRHCDVRNIQVYQSFTQRILRVGTVEISSAAPADAEIRVAGIPDPDRVRTIIDQHR